MESDTQALLNDNPNGDTVDLTPAAALEIEIANEPLEEIIQEGCFENTFNRIYISHFLSAWVIYWPHFVDKPNLTF